MDGFFELESLLQCALQNWEFFYIKLIASEKIKNWNQKFYKGNLWTFGSPYMMIRLFLSREVNWITLMMWNNLLVKYFFADTLDSIF